MKSTNVVKHSNIVDREKRSEALGTGNVFNGEHIRKGTKHWGTYKLGHVVICYIIVIHLWTQMAHTWLILWPFWAYSWSLSWKNLLNGPNKKDIPRPLRRKRPFVRTVSGRSAPVVRYIAGYDWFATSISAFMRTKINHYSENVSFTMFYDGLTFLL